MKKEIFKIALAHALGTALYIVLIGIFLSNTKNIFGPEEPKTVLVPIAMLCLFVLSAAITGFLVFGRPLMWYLDGKKKDSVTLLSYTLGAFFVITLIAFGILYFVLKS